MPKQPKSEECQRPKCTRHAFSLKPIKGKKGLYLSKVTNAKFCPKFNKQSRKFQCSLPFVFQDDKIYTPIFILNEEKKYYEENDTRMKISHAKKIQDFAQKSQLLIPRHVRKRQYCSVCKVEYQQYLNHIQSEEHRVKSRLNKYNQYILDLQKIVNAKKFKKTTPHLEQFSEDLQKVMSDQLKTG